MDAIVRDRFADTHAALTFASVLGPYLLVRVGPRSPSGDRYLGVRFESGNAAREHARAVLRGDATFAACETMFGLRAAASLDLTDLSLSGAPWSELPPDPSLVPTAVYAYAPSGMPHATVSAAIAKAVEAAIAAPGPATAAETVAPRERPPAKQPRDARKAKKVATETPPDSTAAPSRPERGEVRGDGRLLPDTQVHEWSTVRDMVVRVKVNEYRKGRFYVDLRRWFEKGGQLHPSREGFTISAGELPDLRLALERVGALVGDPGVSVA